MITTFTRHLITLLLATLALAALPAQTLAESSHGPAPDTLAGKTVLVTGSTDGMGRQLALELAALGAQVIVHGRNVERGAEVVREIEAAGHGSAVFYAADFALLDNVRTFAATIRDRHDRLDLLINNAGIWRQADDETRRLSEDGHELVFAVNYLAGYLLSYELLPLLERSAPARIVNVASRAQQPIDFDDVMLEQAFSASRAYAQSKLAQIIFTMDVAEEFAERGVTVTSLHPASLMDTTMVRLAGVPPRATVEEGVEAVMQLAVSPALEGRTGLYFQGLEEARAHEQAYDESAQAALRALSESLTTR